MRMVSEKIGRFFIFSLYFHINPLYIFYICNGIRTPSFVCLCPRAVSYQSDSLAIDKMRLIIPKHLFFNQICLLTSKYVFLLKITCFNHVGNA